MSGRDVPRIILSVCMGCRNLASKDFKSQSSPTTLCTGYRCELQSFSLSHGYYLAEDVEIIAAPRGCRRAGRMATVAALREL